MTILQFRYIKRLYGISYTFIKLSQLLYMLMWQHYVCISSDVALPHIYFRLDQPVLKPGLVFNSSLSHCISYQIDLRSQFSDLVRFGKHFLFFSLNYAILRHSWLTRSSELCFFADSIPYKKNQRKHGMYLLLVLNFQTISLLMLCSFWFWFWFWYHIIACLMYEFNPWSKTTVCKLNFLLHVFHSLMLIPNWIIIFYFFYRSSLLHPLSANLAKVTLPCIHPYFLQ